MPKKVKTKKQKMLADLRLQNTSQISEKTDFTTYSLPKLKNIDKKSTVLLQTQKTPPKNVSTEGFAYLQRDLRKTILLTLSIVFAQILIKYYFKF